MSKKTILVVGKFIFNMARLLQPALAHSLGGEGKKNKKKKKKKRREACVRNFLQAFICSAMADVKILRSSSSDNDLADGMI